MVLYLLSGSFSEIIIIFGSFILALPLPFLPAQILWINLITDGLPNLALTMEKEEAGIMLEKPQKRNKPILDQEQHSLIIIISLITGGGTLLIFYLIYQLTNDLDLARTIAFTALGVSSLFYVFSCRSLRHSIFTKNIFSNLYLIGAVIISFVFQLLAIYWPPLQFILRTKSLQLEYWFFIISISVVVILMIELVKMFFLVQRKKSLKFNKLTN